MIHLIVSIGLRRFGWKYRSIRKVACRDAYTKRNPRTAHPTRNPDDRRAQEGLQGIRNLLGRTAEAAVHELTFVYPKTVSPHAQGATEDMRPPLLLPEERLGGLPTRRGQTALSRPRRQDIPLAARRRRHTRRGRTHSRWSAAPPERGPWPLCRVLHGSPPRPSTG